MDDKSYSNTDTNATGPDAPAGALIVAATGLKDADKFTGCYFTINGLSWTLFSKGGTQLATGQSTSSGFTFSHDLLKGSSTTKIAWATSNCVYTITNNVITKITGGWSNDDDDDPAEAPPSGTFQASSGGAMDVVSASASAS